MVKRATKKDLKSLGEKSTWSIILQVCRKFFVLVVPLVDSVLLVVVDTSRSSLFTQHESTSQRYEKC